MLISSPTNSRLKAVAALSRRRAREQTRATVVEGHEEIALAVSAGRAPRELFVCPELFSPSGYAGLQEIGSQDELVTRVRALGAPVVEVARAAFERIAYREGADGLLAVMDSPAVDLTGLTLPERPFLLIAQGIEKPGNLGAMLRTADAVGVDAVIAVDPVTDWGNPNVVRSSKGTVMSVPVAAASTDETLRWLGDRGVPLVATTPETPLLHTDADLTGACAIVVGSEKHGIDPVLMGAAAQRVRIPMHGRANSLNVSVSAAVVLYEAVRQRAAAR